MKEKSSGAGTGEGELILVIDDHEEVLELMAFNLQGEGFRVETAGDGLAAVNKAESSRPDLILVDLILPEINGFSLCELFRHSPATAKTPIIMISGWDYGMARTIGLEAGADDYVTKPFSFRDLIPRIKTLLVPRGEISLRPPDPQLT